MNRYLMKNNVSPQKEMHLQYLKNTVNVSRKEVAAIMWLSRISLAQLVQCLKKREPGTPDRSKA